MINTSEPGRFSRSWEITKQTFHVMKQDKEILLFPILSGIFSIILFLIFVFPFFVAAFVKKSVGGEPLLLYLGIFAFYFIVTFTTVFFNAGVVHIAKTRFEGKNATFMEGIKAGFKNIGKLIQWALVSATIGLILNILSSKAEQQKGILGLIARMAVSLIGLAWAIVSVFVVPAMVLKGIGPFSALKQSAMAIKKTWGESLIRYYGLGLTKLVCTVIGGLILLLPGILILLGGSLYGLVLIGLFVVYFMILSIIFSSANTIFNTALFMYADSGKVPGAYSKETLGRAFKKKG